MTTLSAVLRARRQRSRAARLRGRPEPERVAELAEERRDEGTTSQPALDSTRRFTRIDSAAVEVHRARLGTDVEIAYWREGVGGAPLLLAHGWPETKRIWARNVEPLARAGFEVIVPDLRGFGDSSTGTRWVLRPGGARARPSRADHVARP